MTTHLSADQIRWWIDDNVVQDVTQKSDEGTEFNMQVTLSRLPVHLIKEEQRGPLRVVGRTDLDTERVRALTGERDARTRLLERLGPMLASTPGFYTFLDEEGSACEIRSAATLQLEHRIYPDEATQQALMDSLMSIATGMRYVQNVIAGSYPDAEDETGTDDA